MSDTYTYSGTLSKTVGANQEELQKFTYHYVSTELSAKTIVLPEVDSDNLTTTSQVVKLDVDFINLTPPAAGKVKLVIINVLTPGKRIVAKINVPNSVIAKLNNVSPAEKTASSDESFANTAYNDIEGIIVDDHMVIGGKINNIYLNRYPLKRVGRDTMADSGDCRVSIRVVGG